MKNLSIILAFFSLIGSLTSYAAIDGDGYYRVRNKATDRYVYVQDNKGSFNISTTIFDLGAISLSKNNEKCVSDPACIIYVKHINGYEYDFLAQGTGVSKLFDRYPSMREWPVKKKTGEYRIYGQDGSFVKYLSDGTKAEWKEEGSMTEHDPNLGDYHLWRFYPVDVNTDQFFGIKPDFEADGVYYASFFAEFPFELASDGMKAYYVKTVGKGAVVLDEILTGKVPAKTPVLIRCAGETPADNKVDVGVESSAISGNHLKGVYYNINRDTHINRTAYDKATMRVLGVTAEGRLGYVTGDYDYVPANMSYLVVGAGEPAELPIVSQQEYDEMAGIEGIEASSFTVTVSGNTVTVDGATAPVEVYDITGKCIVRTSNGTFTLPVRGIYLVKSGAVVKKIRY